MLHKNYSQGTLEQTKSNMTPPPPQKKGPSYIPSPARISMVASLEVSALISLTLKTLKKGTSPYYVPSTATGTLYSYSFNAKEQSARYRKLFPIYR